MQKRKMMKLNEVPLLYILLVKSLAAASRRYDRTRQRIEDKIIQKPLHFYI